MVPVAQEFKEFKESKELKDIKGFKEELLHVSSVLKLGFLRENMFLILLKVLEMLALTSIQELMAMPYPQMQSNV